MSFSPLMYELFYHPQKEIENTCSHLLNLGLLYEVLPDRVTLKEQPQYVSFHHKSLQDYSASRHVVLSIETAKDPKVIIVYNLKSSKSNVIAFGSFCLIVGLRFMIYFIIYL